MVPSFLTLQSFLSLWLDVRSLATLDIAVSSCSSRPYWMALLRSMSITVIDNWGHSACSLMWLIRRGIRATRMQMKSDAWRVSESHLLHLKTTNLVHLGLNGCHNIRDLCITNVVYRCRKLNSVDLSECKSLTDAGVSALGDGCAQLQSINLSSCHMVTDVGITTLSQKCCQLQFIDLAQCRKVTDAGVSALSHGCRQLQSINLTS